MESESGVGETMSVLAPRAQALTHRERTTTTDTACLVGSYAGLAVYAVTPAFSSGKSAVKMHVLTNAITRGRPRKNRRIASRGERRKMTCSNCKPPNHNSRRCPVDKVDEFLLAALDGDEATGAALVDTRSDDDDDDDEFDVEEIDVDAAEEDTDAEESDLVELEYAAAASSNSSKGVAAEVKVRLCGWCGVGGHNQRTCASKRSGSAETTS